jgi:hypothetical protein
LKEIQEDRKRVSREKRSRKSFDWDVGANLGEEHCWRRRSKISLSGADMMQMENNFCSASVRGGLILTCKINYLQRSVFAFAAKVSWVYQITAVKRQNFVKRSAKKCLA